MNAIGHTNRDCWFMVLTYKSPNIFTASVFTITHRARIKLISYVISSSVYLSLALTNRKFFPQKNFYNVSIFTWDHMRARFYHFHLSAQTRVYTCAWVVVRQVGTTQRSKSPLWTFPDVSALIISSHLGTFNHMFLSGGISRNAYQYSGSLPRVESVHFF